MQHAQTEQCNKVFQLQLPGVTHITGSHMLSWLLVEMAFLKPPKHYHVNTLIKHSHA